MDYLLGTWITLNHPSIAEILADAGFDWLCIDLEHSATDFFETQQLISTIQSKKLKAFVRVGENNPLIIKRVLDAGADGIIVPSVNSAEEARRVVSAVKYPPLGTRGVGLSRAQGYGFSFEHYRDNVATQITIIAQIEHVNAIKELTEILSVDGLDGTFIGPYDLSGSIGKPGNWNDPEVIELLNNYEIIAKKHNKLVGFHVIQPDFRLVQEKVERGYNFIAFSLDTLFLGSQARHQVNELNKLNK